MFGKVVVANRGEIAVEGTSEVQRILIARELGLGA